MQISSQFREIREQVIHPLHYKLEQKFKILENQVEKQRSEVLPKV